MSASSEYLQKLIADKTVIKAFLSNGTMLQGTLAAFDEEFIIIDKCLVNKSNLISIAFQNK